MVKVWMRFVVMLATVLLVGACGGGGSRSQERASDPELDKKLLTVDDLPSGWSLDSDDDDDDQESPLKCINESRALMEDKASSEASFVKGTDWPIYTEQLVAAADRFDKVADIYNDCGHFETRIEGTKVEGSVDPLSIDSVEGADELAAWRVSMTVEDVTVEGFLAVSSVDDTLLATTYLDVFSADLDEFTDLTSLAVDKVTAS